ncbi:MAG TPA: RnfH family protein [Gammaproteobacteria bacterium]|nr:RnfH family protein [Gammaproteobacteria bacterium]
MNVEVVYARPDKQEVIALELGDGATVQQAIEASRILERCPEIDLETQKMGVFGRVATPETELNEGDRVEIYRPITADPKAAVKRPAG